MENIKELLVVEEIKTLISKKGREIIGILTGHLGENGRGTTLLIFPDIDNPDDPLGWYVGDKQQRSTTYNQSMEIEMVGSIHFGRGHTIEVELDYENGHQARRLKISDPLGVAFFREYVGVVPKWIQAGPRQNKRRNPPAS